jgi:hypothetical protein
MPGRAFAKCSPCNPLGGWISLRLPCPLTSRSFPIYDQSRRLSLLKVKPWSVRNASVATSSWAQPLRRDVKNALRRKQNENDRARAVSAVVIARSVIGSGLHKGPQASLLNESFSLQHSSQFIESGLNSLA